MPLIIGVVAFVVGWVLAKFADLFSKRAASLHTPDEHHQIRSLEASLRIAQKKAAEIAEQFESTCVDFDALKDEHERLEAEVECRTLELEAAKQAVRDETRKVHELRRELTERAEATVRAEAQAKEFKTELDVIQAGTSAIHDEVERLAAEHEDLSNRLKAASGSFEQPEDEAHGADGDRPAEEFQPDC
jgi:chromosome segregation ATPase